MTQSQEFQNNPLQVGTHSLSSRLIAGTGKYADYEQMAEALDGKGDKTNAQVQYKRLIQKFPDTPAATAAKGKLK